MAPVSAAVEKDILKDAMTPHAEEQAEPTATKRKYNKKKPAAVVPQEKVPKMAMISYVPLDEGDLSFTVFFGMKFKANIPREVTNPDAIRLAKHNPWFSVDGAPPVKRAAQRPPRDTSEDVRSVPLPPGAHEIEAGHDDADTSGAD